MNGNQTALDGTAIPEIMGIVVLPKLDVSKYVGRKVKIESVTVMQGKFGFFLSVLTEVIDSNPKDQNGKAIKDKDGNFIVLRASRIFGLQQDAAGNWGWGEQTKTGVFMAKMKAALPKDLIGMEVQVQSITSDNDGKDYLTFN